MFPPNNFGRNKKDSPWKDFLVCVRLEIKPIASVFGTLLLKILLGGLSMGLNKSLNFEISKEEATIPYRALLSLTILAPQLGQLARLIAHPKGSSLAGCIVVLESYRP